MKERVTSDGLFIPGTLAFQPDGPFSLQHITQHYQTISRSCICLYNPISGGLITHSHRACQSS